MRDGRHAHSQNIDDAGARLVAEKTCIFGRSRRISDVQQWRSSRASRPHPRRMQATGARAAYGSTRCSARITSTLIRIPTSTQFNPGLGVECWLNNQWAVTAGGFRNSLRRPSYYGGGVWAPEFAHWGIVRIAAIGGIISGYNYGNWGLGRNHTIGPVVAPIVMLEYKRVGCELHRDSADSLGQSAVYDRVSGQGEVLSAIGELFRGLDLSPSNRGCFPVCMLR